MSERERTENASIADILKSISIPSGILMIGMMLFAFPLMLLHNETGAIIPKMLFGVTAGVILLLNGLRH